MPIRGYGGDPSSTTATGAINAFFTITVPTAGTVTVTCTGGSKGFITVVGGHYTGVQGVVDAFANNNGSGDSYKHRKSHDDRTKRSAAYVRFWGLDQLYSWERVYAPVQQCQRQRSKRGI